MSYKSLEVHYDFASIPGFRPGRDFALALSFRNAAMARIESALSAADLGAWAGSEVGMEEVNFGFEVRDFGAAEDAIRSAVAGTPYAAIRQIARIEADA